MALSVKKGTFTAKTSTGSQAYTGVGFQPKVVLFWLTKQSSVGFAAERMLSFGWGVSSTQRGSLSQVSNDAVTVSTAVGMDIKADHVLDSIDCAANTVSRDLEADLTSLDADGFTLSYSVAGAGTGYIVHYWALGGSDLTNVWAGSFNAPTATGNTAFTGVGFQPDCLLLLTNATGTIPRADVGYKMSLGVTDGTTSALSYVGEQNALPTNLRSLQKTGELIHTYNFSGTDNTVASLVSLDSDGFTLNFTTVQATSRGFLALALKGGNYWVGTDTQKTSTGTQAKTGVGFTPTGLLLFGTNRASSATADTSLASFSVGASDGTTEGCSWVGSTDNVSTTDENSATVTDKILRHATNAATTNAEADLSSFDSDGYTLNWTTADATAREFIALAVGSAAATVTGAASLTITAGVTTAGNRTALGAASQTYTLGITTSAGSSIQGAASLSVTFGATTAAIRDRHAAVSSTLTLGVATAGAAQFFGAASLTETVGISTAGALSTSGSAVLGLNFRIDTGGVRGKSIVLVPEVVDGITLDPKEPGVLP